MRLIEEVIYKSNTTKKPIWLMRQAGRYLPEFREIRKENPNFINLCLNETLVPKITLQPLERFNLNAAIIFSDILMLPFGLGQKVEFKKNFGPLLGDIKDLNINNISNDSFLNKLRPVYNSMKQLSLKLENKEQNLIGFVGGPWTVIVYMLNRQSPKKSLPSDIINFKEIKKLIRLVVEYSKLHIKKQINNGANIIQIFESWAGLADKDRVGELIYEPNTELVEYVKSLGVPAICFPREIDNYFEFIKEVNPSVISIDYNVNINKFAESVKIPVQGNLDPNILLSDKDKLKKETLRILNTFKNHPHIFNLGHGVLPQTDPNMVDYLVNLVKNY